MAYNPKYDDIIDRPHHVSRSHPRMPLSDRAFQFAPFAALSGYADTIRETQRLTERKIELDEGTIEMLNRRYRRLMDTLDSRPTVSITYFRPDERKEGGAYLTVTGVVRKLDPAARRIIMQDGTVIPTAEISAMEGEIFSDMDDCLENQQGVPFFGNALLLYQITVISTPFCPLPHRTEARTGRS